MRTKRATWWVLCSFFCGTQAFAQVGIWKNYTSMQEVRSLARSGNTFWAATSGGLFSWQEGRESFATFTSAEGLQSTDLTAVALDKNGEVWTGTTTGMIHLYSPAKNVWRYIPDITTITQTNKRVNNILSFGDTLLVCTEFGLSVFRNNQFQFGDTYTKFGQLTGNIRVSVNSAAIFGGRLWATVSDRQALSRIAHASLSNPNLLPPEAWTLQALGQSVPRHLVVFNNRLYAGTNSGVFVLSDSHWIAVDSLGGKNVVAMTASANLLVIADQSNAIYGLNTQNAVQRIGPALPSSGTSITLNATNLPTVGSNRDGILSLSNNTWTAHFPNGPASNTFISITTDADGNVWSATGQDGNGKGFYRFDGKTWRSFSRQNSPALPTNDTWRVSTACNGDVWLSAWGQPVATIRMPRGSTSVDSSNIFDRNNSFPPITDAPNYYVIGAAVCDARGNTWFPAMKPANLHGLVVRTREGAWKSLPAIVGGSPQDFNDFRNVSRVLAVDGLDNLWIVAVHPARGVASLNNRGSVSDSVADYLLTSANGLPSDNVNCIAADNDGDIWIGTDDGIAIVLDPGNPTRQGSIASYKPLSGVGVNAIAVDPLNQKWIATNEGAVLLSRDGTQTLAQFTIANTAGKIISNEIKDIAIDARSGTVFFATLGGLASLKTTAAQPQESFQELLVSPNPYRIPNAIPLTIDGLVENSKIKILSVDGHLVREVQSPGGRIGFWDGKDREGNDVGSGVYIIVAYSETKKENVGKGKVAVLRR